MADRAEGLPPAGTRLCAADDVPEGKAREVRLGPSDDPFLIVLFRDGGTVRAYRNRCPHFLLPLNVQPGRFLLLRDGLVMCSWHSAVFRIADGGCIDGPCMGDRLEPVAIHDEAGHIVLT